MGAYFKKNYKAPQPMEEKEAGLPSGIGVPLPSD